MTVQLDFSSISPWNHPRIQFDEEFLYLVISRRLFSLEKILKKGSPKENGKVFQAFLGVGVLLSMAGLGRWDKDTDDLSSKG